MMQLFQTKFMKQVVDMMTLDFPSSYINPLPTIAIPIEVSACKSRAAGVE